MPRACLQPDAFPDYDGDFEALLAAIPEASDTSWKYDTCPSMGVRLGLLRLSIFCDYRDPAKREHPEFIRFTILILDTDGCVTGLPALMEADEFSTVLGWLETTRRFAPKAPGNPA
jgi:hypothetical protein